MRERNRISAISELPEVQAAQRDLDELPGDPHVAEVQRGSSAVGSLARRASRAYDAEAADAFASLALVLK